jgi:predicted transcriptional regulator
MPTFADIVEEVTSLKVEEMEEIRNIISKILVEKKREKYLVQYKEALRDSKEGKLFSSNNIDEIGKWLNDQ